MNLYRSSFRAALLIAIAAVCTMAHAQSEVQAELLMRELIPSAAEGKQVTLFRTVLPPGYKGVSHRHPGETFVYILSGRVINQIEDEKPKEFRAGDFFFEPAGALHARFENPDQEQPAVYIVFGIRPTSEN
jgi:quercetin dioxygenase-like cupin family protein